MTLDEKGISMEATVDDEVDEPVVDMPSEEKTETPSKEPEMITKAQAEKLANERHSKLDRRIAELEKLQEKSTKLTDTAAKRAQDAEDALALARKEVEEAERRAMGDSPDALSLFEAKLAHKQAIESFRRQQEEFEAQKAEWEDAITEAKQFKITKVANEIAAEAGVDPELLVSMTDGSREKMEKLAKVLPKKTAEDKLTLPKPPDSGKKSRVLTNPTVEQLNSMSMEQYAAYVAERDKNKR